MKKLWIVLLVGMVMTGCTSKPNTVKDEILSKASSVANRLLGRGDNYNSQLISHLILMGNYNLWDIEAKKGLQLSGYAKSTFRYALEHSRRDFAYYIIDHGIDLSYQDADGKTEIMYLAKGAYNSIRDKMITKLIASGCDPQMMDAQNHSAIEIVIVESETGNGYSTSISSAKNIELYYKNGVPIRKETIKTACETGFADYTAVKYLSSVIKDELPDYVPENCMEAAFLGDISYLRDHIEEWKDSEDTRTQILFYVAALGDCRSLEDFLRVTNVPFDIKDKNDCTLLMAAAFAGNDENFEYLFDKVPHNTIGSKGETLLVAAVCGGSDNIFNKIKTEPEEVFDYRKLQGQEDMHELIEADVWSQLVGSISIRGDSGIIQWCLDTYEWQEDTIKKLCRYILDMDDIQCFETVLNHKEVTTFLEQDASFVEAILDACSSPEEVKLILSKIPDSFKNNLSKSLAVTLSRSSNRIIEDSANIVKEYYHAGVPLDENKYGRSPLLEAVEVGDTAAVKELIQCGSDINQREEKEGRSALHTTTIGDYITMEVLLEEGAEVDILSNNGGTPLIWAARKGTAECVKLLLEYGADKTIKDLEGKTAYDWAIESGYEEIALLLEE